MSLFTSRGSRPSRLAALAAVAASVALVTSACGAGETSGSPGSSQEGAAKDLSIGFLPKALGNPYFQDAAKGSEEASKELKGTFAEVGPAVSAADAQVSFINTLSQQGTTGIVLSASDPTAPGSALTAARKAGTKVVTFDSDVEPKFRDLFIAPATDASIAKIQVDLLVKQIGESGEVAILGASANAKNQNAWISGMKAELAKNHPNLKLVDTVYGNDDDQESFNKTAALLQSHPQLKGIIACTNVGLAAAARYISDSSFKGKVALTGLGTPNATRDYINNGTVSAFALYSPKDMGYLATYAIDALTKGTISGKEGETFTAGRLGKYTVGKDGVLNVGDPIVFDKSNIGKYDF
jgi:rhamnose transport system substrate-binding protein